MQTLKLTKKDFKKSNSYWSDYIGKTDVSDYDGHIEITGELGYVRFNSIKAEGRIVAKAGTGIEAGDVIETGLPDDKNDKKQELLSKADELIKQANELKSKAEEL